MKSKLVLIFLLLNLLVSSNVLSSENDYISQFPNQEAWIQDFKQYALNHEDKNVQVYGLMMSMGWGAHKGNDEQLKVIHTKFEELSQDETLSAQAMLMMDSLCSHPNLLSLCDATALMEQTMRVHADDFMAYMSPLSAAINLGIEGEVVDLIQQMANTQKMTKMMYLSESFNNALDNYAKNNPFTDDHLHEAWIDNEIIFNRNSWSEKDHEYVKKQFPVSLLLIKKMGIQLDLPVIAYRGVLYACETYSELRSDCLNISSKLTAVDDDYMSVTIGYAIKEIVYEALGDSKALNHAKSSKQALKDEMSCFRKFMKSDNVFQRDAQEQIEILTMHLTSGDRSAFKKHAEFKVREAEREGIELDESSNPLNCFKGAES